MKRKKKKSLKGMTLMECIVAIAVLGALGMLVVLGAVSAVSNMRAAHSVSEKNAAQSPYASSKLNANSTGSMTFYLDGTDGHMTVDKFEVQQHQSTDDKVGNYRYFDLPTPTP